MSGIGATGEDSTQYGSSLYIVQQVSASRAFCYIYTMIPVTVSDCTSIAPYRVLLVTVPVWRPIECY
jgi:hypothetical protein